MEQILEIFPDIDLVKRKTFTIKPVKIPFRPSFIVNVVLRFTNSV